MQEGRTWSKLAASFPKPLIQLENSLPSIPAKRYFTISEVGSLCGVKPHVLRYWEQEFTQLRPTKRRGNRRYYQLHEVQLIRKIRELLYEHGFTIVGARNKLQGLANGALEEESVAETFRQESESLANASCDIPPSTAKPHDQHAKNSLELTIKKSGGSVSGVTRPLLHQVRDELLDIRNLLEPSA